jgi:hypothetical protein
MILQVRSSIAPNESFESREMRRARNWPVEMAGLDCLFQLK